jgi:single-strand DNA-binding protein
MSYIEVAALGATRGAPIARSTQTGKRYLTLDIGVRGKGSTETEWLNVSAFEAVADAIPDDLGKGERVYVEGRARINRWSTKDGQPRASLQVTASKVLVLDRIGRKRREPKAPELEPSRGDWQSTSNSQAECAINDAEKQHRVPAPDENPLARPNQS